MSIPDVMSVDMAQSQETVPGLKVSRVSLSALELQAGWIISGNWAKAPLSVGLNLKFYTSSIFEEPCDVSFRFSYQLLNIEQSPNSVT